MREVLCPVVVGRDEELAVLEQSLEEAQGGRGGAVAYRPFAEALLGALRATRPPELAELGPFQSALGRLVPEWSGGPTRSVALLRSRSG
jgi:hypothetical protein